MKTENITKAIRPQDKRLLIEELNLILCIFNCNHIKIKKKADNIISPAFSLLMFLHVEHEFDIFLF